MYLYPLSDATGKGPGRSDDDVSQTLVYARNGATSLVTELYVTLFLLSLGRVDLTFWRDCFISPSLDSMACGGFLRYIWEVIPGYRK